MLIRQEKTEDYEKVYNIIKEAFALAEHSDGSEQDLVNKLRKSKNFIPELSLVAIENDTIVGHIMFTKAYLGETEVLALAPLAVLPEYQKTGIGKALIAEGHKIAKNMGYICSVVLGSEKYYPKMGYVPACEYGIISPFDVAKENFMAINLTDKEIKFDNTLEYAKEFFEE